MDRPYPPVFVTMPDFKPDQDGLGTWVRHWFIEPGTPLSNPEHEHLRMANIGWLWANAEAASRGRRIAGEACIPTSGNSWARQRGEAQLIDWFGDVPDFLITIDAEIALQATDAQFCALVEHELYHCAQALDLYGCPKFNRDGMPVFTMRGHDVEQFVGVVARYGADAAGVAEMVRAAQIGPVLQDDAVPLACGTCAGRKAA